MDGQKFSKLRFGDNIILIPHNLKNTRARTKINVKNGPETAERDIGN